MSSEPEEGEAETETALAAVGGVVVTGAAADETVVCVTVVVAEAEGTRAPDDGGDVTVAVACAAKRLADRIARWFTTHLWPGDYGAEHLKQVLLPLDDDDDDDEPLGKDEPVLATLPLLVLGQSVLTARHSSVPCLPLPCRRQNLRSLMGAFFLSLALLPEPETPDEDEEPDAAEALAMAAASKAAASRLCCDKTTLP